MVMTRWLATLNGRMSRPGMGRLSGEPQVAFLGATDPTADRQTGDIPDQVSNFRVRRGGPSVKF